MGREIRIVVLFILIIGVSGGTEARRRTHPYRRQYVRETYGKKALAGVGVGAGIKHAGNSPKEWGGGVAGLGKRAASGMGTHVVKNTIQFGVAAARHEDLHYYR